MKPKIENSPNIPNTQPLKFTLPQSIDFYENYITAVFPLPKLDIVPLPAFGIGAMENWGLITIREEFYYTDNETRFDRQLFMK